MKFRDRTDGCVLEPASEFVARQMMRNPNLEPLDERAVEPVDLTSLTVATLRELCADRGIDVPKRATKAQLIGLLGE